jgi:hypothetical protein
MVKSTPLEKIEQDDIPDKMASDEERVSRIIQEINGDVNVQETPGSSQEEQQDYNQMATPTRYIPDSVMQPHPSELFNKESKNTRDAPINKIEEPEDTEEVHFNISILFIKQEG